MNGAQFLEIFYEKYFPQSNRDRKVSEFENLKQGNKTIAEYEVQSTKLACFAPYMVDTDYKKARKFEGCLQDSILEKINILQVQKYVDVLDKAIIVEGNQANHNWYSDWKGKRQGSIVRKGSASSQSKKQNLGTSNTSGSTCDSSPTYPECGKKGQRVFYRALGACFNYGKTGHMVRDCPMFGQQKGNRPSASSAGSTPATKKIVLCLGNEKEIGQLLVQPVLLLQQKPWQGLLLLETIYMEPLNYVLCVSLPFGDYVLCASMYPACELLLKDIPLWANLMPLDMVHFDIILGMDWLAKYHTTIDCVSKQVVFRPPGQEKTEVGVENIQIFSEFPDVFHEEFPGDLIDREIEFVIDIVPGTQPISKALYRMSLAEMKELKI
ncbi:uncharacterized protein LOC114284293 [Camellia sinensis]|uniref:uncharacterized protein LOC114284293 n=1 Tax=Camellia sinensis TaxID=4442 RepID=UPI0010364BB4|nr:uncharacterized protein LOC114284293 [Camellia sinensis]